MENACTTDTPIRLGVFSNLDAAECAVDELLKAGFPANQITVICSDRAKAKPFRQLESEPAEPPHAAAAATGGAIGAALGGLSVMAGLVTSGGLGLLAAGGLAASTGGLVGGLVSAMMTRGVENELAEYYDHAVTQGKILVAVEDQSEAQLAMLAKATCILTECGAEPVGLPVE